MVKIKFLIVLSLLLFLPFTLALSVGPNVNGGERVVFVPTIKSTNFTAVNTNSSDFWDNYDTFSQAILENRSKQVTFEDNVGIGTTSPNAKLDVKTTGAGEELAHFEGSLGKGLRIWNWGTYPTAVDLASINSAVAVYNDMHLRAGNFIQLWLDVDGNVGIGTTSPEKKLVVYDAVNGATIRLQNAVNSAEWEMRRDITSGDFVISDDSLGDVFTIDQVTGNVGIGTASPTHKLNVLGTTNLSGDTLIEGDNSVYGDSWIIRPNGDGNVVTQYSSVGGTGWTIGINDANNDFFIGTQFYIDNAAPANSLFVDAGGVNVLKDLDVAGNITTQDTFIGNFFKTLTGSIVTFFDNLFVIGNITSENVFIPQDIFSHTNRTQVLAGANIWTNVTFDQEVADIKYGIEHYSTNSSNETFIIMEDGVYFGDYDFDLEDTSVGASDIDIAGRLIFINGTEVVGSDFESGIEKNGVEKELSHDFLFYAKAGDKFKFQFVADDADVVISTHGTFGDHPESASIIIKKERNL